MLKGRKIMDNIKMKFFKWRKLGIIIDFFFIVWSFGCYHIVVLNGLGGLIEDSSSIISLLLSVFIALLSFFEILVEIWLFNQFLWDITELIER